MISYTLPESLAFCDQFSPFTPTRNELIVYPASLMSPWPWTPQGIIERTLSINLWWNESWGIHGALPDFRLPSVAKFIEPQMRMAIKILFDLSLEELIPYINEPEPYISYIEWRLKLGR